MNARVLFVMASPEYLRYYDTTLGLLADRGHALGLAVMQDTGKKQARLRAAEAAPGIEVLGTVPRTASIWTDLGKGVRGTVDYLRYLHPRFAHAPAIRSRMEHKALPRGLRLLARVREASPEAVRRGVRLLVACDWSLPADPAVDAFVASWRPDAVVVSPLVDAASPEVEVVKAAHRLGVPVAVCIASWDNLTNKGLLRVQPDAVIVWNEAQKREAVEYHYAAPDRVVTTGAQPFDRWFNRAPSRSLDGFVSRCGLSVGRPFLLFTGSSSFISEANAEVQFVRRWIAALRGSASEEVRGLSILVRPHPYNAHVWADTDVSDLPGVAVWPKGPYNAIDDETRADFFDSLYFSRAVVGINTSAMIEAAVVGRPVLSIQAPEFAGTQDGTVHFHHLLPANGGFLRLSSSIEEHLRQLEEVMADPEGARTQLDGFVRTFVRPQGLDRPSAPMVADAIERLAAAGQRPARHRRWWEPPLCAVTAGAGGVVWAIGAATDPRRTGRLVKKARKAWRQTDKGTRRLLRRGTRVFRTRSRKDKHG